MALLATTARSATDRVVVDGVVYEWHSANNQYGYVATGWDEDTPIQSLHIHGQVGDGYDVLGIAARAFEDNHDIVYVKIDEGVAYIGQNAFDRCTSLEVAVLPEGLTTIEEEAFAFCNALTTMVIPSTVSDIQSHAFAGCTGVTDVYFLMNTEQLAGFDWWDGIYHDAPQEAGGMEFNQSRHRNPTAGTRVHVPQGLLGAYEDSGKMEAWLLQEDDNSYPLWWIVNYGLVGRDYTVSDDLSAIYKDVAGNLYAKDDNHWLMPDRVYAGEVNYMLTSGQRSGTYDQSNWVELRDGNGGSLNLADCLGYIVAGGSVTGRLVDKRNPAMLLTSAPTKGGAASYTPNTYLPCAFMGRTQVGNNGTTYAFVQPKPQEYARIEQAVYAGDNDAVNQFYIAAPDGKQVNPQHLAGGFDAALDLYEEPEAVPELASGSAYAFNAINRKKAQAEATPGGLRRAAESYEPYADGGVSTEFVVMPLLLSSDPIITGIAEVAAPRQAADSRWFGIDGRCLGTSRPAAPGCYIHQGQKVMVR